MVRGETLQNQRCSILAQSGSVRRVRLLDIVSLLASGISCFADTCRRFNLLDGENLSEMGPPFLEVTTKAARLRA